MRVTTLRVEIPGVVRTFRGIGTNSHAGDPRPSPGTPTNAKDADVPQTQDDAERRDVHSHGGPWERVVETVGTNFVNSNAAISADAVRILRGRR
jgi:hypothetical protein